MKSVLKTRKITLTVWFTPYTMVKWYCHGRLHKNNPKNVLPQKFPTKKRKEKKKKTTYHCTVYPKKTWHYDCVKKIIKCKFTKEDQRVVFVYNSQVYQIYLRNFRYVLYLFYFDYWLFCSEDLWVQSLPSHVFALNPLLVFSLWLWRMFSHEYQSASHSLAVQTEQPRMSAWCAVDVCLVFVWRSRGRCRKCWMQDFSRHPCLITQHRLLDETLVLLCCISSTLPSVTDGKIIS